jgi:hypothetical protein
MSMTSTMKWMGRSARNRAEAVGHQMKDRALQMRLERAAEENERLRAENETLRDSVEESRTDHRRILEMLEARLAPLLSSEDVEVEKVEKKSHRGRRFMFLLMLAGAGWAWMRSKTGGRPVDDVWAERPDTAGSTGTTSESGKPGTTGSTGTTSESGKPGTTGSTGTGRAGKPGDPGVAA